MLKDKRIHQSKIWQIMERRKDGKPLEFSIQFCKKSNGELVTYDRVNPEKPDVPLNKNDAFQKVQKRRVQEKR